MRRDTRRGPPCLCSMAFAASLIAATGCAEVDQGEDESSSGTGNGDGDGDGDGFSECGPDLEGDWGPVHLLVYFSEGLPNVGVGYPGDYVVGECSITGFGDGVAPDDTTEVLLVHMDCTTVEEASQGISLDAPVTLAISRLVESPKIETLPVGAALAIAYGIDSSDDEEWSESYGRIEGAGEVLAVWGAATGPVQPPLELEALPAYLPITPWFPFEASCEYGVCPEKEGGGGCWTEERFGYRFESGDLALDGQAAVVDTEGGDYLIGLRAEVFRLLDTCNDDWADHATYYLRAVAI